MNTSSKGEFSFDELPMFGALKLKITAVGYRPYEQTVSFQMNFAGMPKQSASSSDTPNMSALTTLANAFDKDLLKKSSYTKCAALYFLLILS